MSELCKRRLNAPNIIAIEVSKNEMDIDLEIFICVGISHNTWKSIINHVCQRIIMRPRAAISTN